MKISTDRILTTHVGSLPRPASLEAKLLARERGELDAASLDAMPDEITTAVRDVVKRQADLGISIVDDGEMSKYAYATYARDRMTGLTGVVRAHRIPRVRQQDRDGNQDPDLRRPALLSWR